ncbi:MAG TPA: ankyrin repeat domain-containing protein [Candidatus Acidoferrum sp.]|nr:ankyrin repeat domain-containing protein [Candidatus Acidoferrum sp.]
MPVRRLPSNPNLDHLKYQARDLLEEHATCAQGAAQRIREFHPRFGGATDSEIFGARLSLSDAQLAIAREYGFPSWTRLKRHIERPTLSDQLDLPHHQRIEDDVFRRAVDLLDTGDVSGLREHLKKHPHLAQQRVVFEGGNYFRNPALLEFVAENPIRHGTLPANIAEIARVILEVGTSQSARDGALALVSTGSVSRKCGVQLALIDALCDYGANPNTAAHASALHGELEALKTLIRHGARMDLPVAAALGRVEDARRLLEASGGEERHLALSLAADFGHVQIVRLLLDAGENPDRYNPVGGHSHATPLHQAAGRGHKNVVQLLVERGARTDMKDILWQATPADWARHAGKLEIEAFLRGQDIERKQKD